MAAIVPAGEGASNGSLTHAAARVRLVEVGDSAGPTITLPAQVLLLD
jgi:hypothetical protein